MFVGFGFVGFDSEDVVEKLAQARFHTINGKSVSVVKCSDCSIRNSLNCKLLYDGYCIFRNVNALN